MVNVPCERRRVSVRSYHSAALDYLMELHGIVRKNALRVLSINTVEAKKLSFFQ